ncbi:hypothetical protein LTR37_008307 [Vermiconidia calcicola]|uniref:Uncharacterized protein n=1 Tax=Vermiconidia calcicola TaxID=1690605 RepID=A0ACC3NBR2_9PEZI|nr:hypothetical protein LTR37_008307 [Vermiconidia calcicola]
MPQQPAPTASTSTNSNADAFPPQYEAQVNENMRSFGDVEGQVGHPTVIFDQTAKPVRRWATLTTRAKVLSTTIMVLFVAVCIIIIVIICRKDDYTTDVDPTIPGSPSRAAEIRSHLDAAHIVTTEASVVTVTQSMTTTKLDTTTFRTTITETAPIPTSIMQKLNSYEAEVSRIAASMLASANSRVSDTSFLEVSTTVEPPPTAMTLMEATPTPIPVSGESEDDDEGPAICAGGAGQNFCYTKRSVAEMLTSLIALASSSSPSPSSSSSIPSEEMPTPTPTPTTMAMIPDGGGIGFCGTPGSPCLNGRDVVA